MGQSSSVDHLIYVRHRTERPSLDVEYDGNARSRPNAGIVLENGVVTLFRSVTTHRQAVLAAVSLPELVPCPTPLLRAIEGTSRLGLGDGS